MKSRPAGSQTTQPELRLGGIALSNGLVVVSNDHWAAAVREDGGGISVASGERPHLPGSRAGAARLGGGLPVLRGLGRFAESLLVLGLVKVRLPGARLPFEERRVAAALAASMAGATAVRSLARRSALAQETGTALAAFIPAVLSVKNSPVSGYHGAEHKVIGAHEEALRAAKAGRAAAPAPKEHDRCGSNLVGPFLFASVITNLLARDRRGRKTPLRSAAAGAASLGLALEALRWAEKHAGSLPARLMMMPGRAIQKSLTTSEPTPEQLEVGERALAELLRLEGFEA